MLWAFLGAMIGGGLGLLLGMSWPVVVFAVFFWGGLTVAGMAREPMEKWSDRLLALVGTAVATIIAWLMVGAFV